MTHKMPRLGAILVLAANTAFNGFPILASILAHLENRRRRRT